MRMESPERFISRPVRVVAIQWLGDNVRAVQDFVWPASPFYAPCWTSVMGAVAAQLRVRVRDELAEEKYPALGPQWKEIDVPLGSWIVRGLNETSEIVMTAARFQAMFRAAPTGLLN